jgi:hypothetical protein
MTAHATKVTFTGLVGWKDDGLEFAAGKNWLPAKSKLVQERCLTTLPFRIFGTF